MVDKTLQSIFTVDTYPNELSVVSSKVSDMVISAAQKLQGSNRELVLVLYVPST